MPEEIHIDSAGDLGPAIAVIQATCDDAGAPCFIVGAAARDLLLEHAYGVRPFRATGDVDVAVAVGSWEEYTSILARLVGTHGFMPTEIAHRVTRAGLILDVMPFGEIANEDHSVTWPGEDRTMSVLGYPEAFQAAVRLHIGTAPAVWVASLPGVGVLKMVAWTEAPHRRPQDPIDLCTIMTSYDDVVGERFYTEHDDLFAEDSFELKVASSRVYGRDVGGLLKSEALRHVVLATLDANTRDDYDSPLALRMGTECEPDFTVRLRCLRAFAQGVHERLPPSTRDA